ncbi:hypothetical protein H2202_009780 [Exophiala xenobiotica]|nr:hypothetical protein H2202_009780 [Exophiala xenobiotica]
MLDGDAAHAFDLGLGVEGLDLTWLDSCYSPFADLDSASERYAGDLGIDHEQGITAETGDSDMAQEGTIPTDAMPEGMCLVQLDPWAAHRGSILEQLRTTGKLTADQISWLSCANMKLFLGSFFRYLHRHTPFIHCPTWNISTARTHLILSMMLVGAMYAGDLKVNGPKVRELRDLAEQYAWRIDERSINDPSSNHASGLYRDNSIIYWYLGCLLAQHGSPFMQYDSASSGRYRFIGVPRLMKDLNLFMKKGHLDRANTSDEVIAALSDPQWIAHLEGLRRGQGPKPGGAGVTTSSRQNAGDIQLHPAPGEPNLPAAEEENMDRLALDFMLSRSL